MQDTIKLCLIVAQGRNRVIGSRGQLPWRLADDLAFFKSVTMGAPLVMGRKTWESLPRRPLPGRENIVLSQDWTYDAPGARVYSSFAPALNSAKAMAARAGADKVFVIGGEAIYALALPFADRIYLTEVDASPEGDAFFPPLEAADWSEASAEVFAAGAGNDHAFVIRTLDRVRAPA